MGKDSEVKEFPEAVVKALKYYVYRLIDPRDGHTFYVGKGKGNRVFDHLKCALKNNLKQDDISEKIQIIREIESDGLKVICIIHRHGIEDEKTALEIEGALIDAYPGLSNIQGGYGNADYGCMNTEQIINLYSAPIADIPQNQYLIIKIREETVKTNNGSIYEAVRKHWRVDENKVKTRKYILACVSGIIKEVFEVDNTGWKNSPEPFKNRMFFDGKVAPEDIREKFRGKALPKKFIKKGAASPIRYA